MSNLREICDAQQVILGGTRVTYAQKVSAINTMLAAVEAAIADPSLTDTTRPAIIRYNALVGLEKLRNAIYDLSSQSLGVNSRPRTYVVPPNGEPMSLAEIARAIWGDGSRWSELLEGNAIHTPNAVRPGTVIRVLAR